MEIKHVDINSIQPSQYNPRAITQKALNGLKKSIKQFGMPQPLVVNKKTGNLVSGHQRLEAAKQLGHTEVPIIYVELSISKEKALNVVLNNKSTQGDFTDELQGMLNEIELDLGKETFEELNLGDLVENFSFDETPVVEESEKEKREKCPTCGK